MMVVGSNSSFGGLLAAVAAMTLLLLPQVSQAQNVTILECAEDGSGAHYEETLEGSNTTMVRRVVSETGCPNHVNWAINPNPAKETPLDESIPAYPMLMTASSDLSTAEGPIGIMRNGVAMYSSWVNVPVVEYEDTAFYQEADTIDPCGGHTTPNGSYHYHGTAGCLQAQAGAVEGQHSPLLGWAYDGFPFYGQLGPDGVEMKMCGVDGADSTYCLDECSGYEGPIDEDDFLYRYYTSCGFDESFFPFTANCFRGCCPANITCSEHVELCGTQAVLGYSTNHIPIASTSLDDIYDAYLISGNDTDMLNSNSTVDCSLFLGSGSSGAEEDSASSDGDAEGSDGDAEEDEPEKDGAPRDYSSFGYMSGMVLISATIAGQMLFAA